MHATRPTRAEISRSALRHNFDTIRAHAGTSVAAVVKADAYGHGAVEAARVFADAGAAWLAVALPEEGAALRAAGLALPILCLGGFWEGQEPDLLDLDLTPEVYRPDQLLLLDAFARRRGVVASYHLKVDTGMGRLGVPPDALDAMLDTASSLANARCDGLMTHFASADVPDLKDFTREQIARFARARAAVEARGLRPRWFHMSNSAGTYAFPEARGNLVRPGAVLYGLERDVISPEGPGLALRPAMRLVSQIEHLKTVPHGTPLGYGCTHVTTGARRIATVPAGYADGVRRGLSNAGVVTVRGVRAPIVGRVSMDLTIVDVTDVPGAALGDDVVFFGDGEVRVEEVAATAGTISYEITCGVSARVPRVYVE